MKKNKKILGTWQGKRYDYSDFEKMTMKYLVEKLDLLNKSFNVVGIKQSFEDEGALLSDVLTMRRITELCNLEMYVKIGGCEAITDINNCATMGINNIIAPMVETPYSFQKFINAVKNITHTHYYFLCETKTAYNNIDEIFKTSEASKLSGVIVGRSDFAKSYNLDKARVNEDFLGKKVKDIFEKSKERGLITTMGGNISVDSVEFIQSLYEKGLLDKVETRNIVVELNDNNIKDLKSTIEAVIMYEIEWLRFKAINYTNIGESYLRRVSILENRIK